VREREISVSTSQERNTTKNMANMLIKVCLNKFPEKMSNKKQNKTSDLYL
jgi:hypothetical protein